jgi:hypothetical protein
MGGFGIHFFPNHCSLRPKRFLRTFLSLLATASRNLQERAIKEGQTPMNSTPLRARDIEAHALATLSAEPDARARDTIACGHARLPAARFARTRRMFHAAAIFEIAALAVALWFLSASISLCCGADASKLEGPCRYK